MESIEITITKEMKKAADKATYGFVRIHKNGEASLYFHRRKPRTKSYDTEEVFQIRGGSWNRIEQYARRRRPRYEGDLQIYLTEGSSGFESLQSVIEMARVGEKITFVARLNNNCQYYDDAKFQNNELIVEVHKSDRVRRVMVYREVLSADCLAKNFYNPDDRHMAI